ncbi:arginine/serine-rich protein 1 isoform X1 [Engraulis encrasicolus]|uniref:arginine/serine-rich protein 1 isoform X1 n=1 Tax=Engraulis encrasicolus TaxID=184585 RepID=UPI002FD217FE
MKTTARDMQIETARLSEGMRLIFDQAAPSGSSSSSPRSRSSSSSGRSSRSTSRAAHSSKRQRRRSLRRSSRSSSSSSGSSVTSSGPSRSRSHPRCHRRSSPRHCCGRHCHSPPRHYRARSRSYSPSPDKSRRHGSRSRRYHRSSANRSYRARSRSYSCSPSSERRRRHHQRSYRSRSRSERSSSRQHQGFVGRYRCRFPDSPRSRSPRSNRSRSRTSQSSSVHLSQDEKRELLKIAAENAAKTVGAERLVFPESVKRDLLSEESASERATPSPDRSTPVHSKLVSPEPESRQSPTQVRETVSEEDDELSTRTSPKRKPITFSVNNAFAKPTHGKPHGMTEAKVTPRVDIVGSRKPYGQWVTVKTTTSRSSKH